MLKELFINNYLLIEKAHLSFPLGLVAVTGETGSGKSLFIKALSVLMGKELRIEAIRDPSKDLLICATFSIDQIIDKYLREAGLSVEQELLIVRYKLCGDGSSSFYVNDQSVSAKLIKDLGPFLFEMHGQHANLSLLKASEYIEILDSYAGLKERVSTFSLHYRDYLKQKEDWENWLKEIQAKQQNSDYLLKVLQEIEEIAPKVGEEEELIASLEEGRKLESLALTLEKINTGFYLEDSPASGVLPSLAKLQRLAESLQEKSKSLESLFQRMQEAYYELEDVAESYHQLSRGLPSLLEQRESQQARLFVLTKLRKKLSLPTLKQVLEYAQEIKSFIEDSENLEEMKQSRKQLLQQQHENLYLQAQEISHLRREKIKELEGQVNEVLRKLHMSELSFIVEIKSARSLNFKGLDKVGFYLHQAGKTKTLADMASGGELSRIMLALSTLKASSCGSSCLVFDEIDAGLGGKAGASLGKYLYKLSLKRQILVVTHLASVAAWAEEHICLRKEIEQQSASTFIFSLPDASKRVDELARMLSGHKGANSLAHAKELLANFQKEKKEVKVCQG